MKFPKLLQFLSAAVALTVAAPSCNAVIDKVFSLDASGVQITADSVGQLVYVPDQKNQQVIIVNSNTLSIQNTIALPGTPQDIAIDETLQRAYITLNSFSQVVVLDLNSMEFLDPIALPQPGFEIVLTEYDIFVTSYGQSSGIMRIDRGLNQYMGSFSGNVSTYQRSALELTPDKSRLIFANRGLSPGTLAIFDITSDTPELIIRNGHGDLGSNGQAIAVDPVAGQFVSYAVGGGNGSGYSIAKLDIADLSWIGEFVTGPYPRAVHHSIDGFSTYTNNTAGEVSVWDNRTMGLLDTFNVAGNPKDFADLQEGALVAVIGDTEFAIYQVADFNPEPPVPETSGNLKGLTLYKAVCINRSTGQRVRVKQTAEGFDCVEAGLEIQVGDDIRINLFGTVDEVTD